MTTLEKEGKVLLPQKLKEYYVLAKHQKQSKDKMMLRRRNHKPEFLKAKGDYSHITYQHTTATGNTSPSYRWNQTQSSVRNDTARHEQTSVQIDRSTGGKYSNMQISSTDHGDQVQCQEFNLTTTPEHVTSPRQNAINNLPPLNL